MKRAVYLILALAMCFSLCACQHTDKEETERKAAEIAAAEALAAKQESACKKADSIDGVTVVWCATQKDGKSTRVVGFYKNATVYRYPQ